MLSYHNNNFRTILILVIVLGLTACGGGGGTTPAPAAADTTPPKIISTIPTSEQIEVAPSTAIIVKYNEGIKTPIRSNIVIYPV